MKIETHYKLDKIASLNHKKERNELRNIICGKTNAYAVAPACIVRVPVETNDNDVPGPICVESFESMRRAAKSKEQKEIRAYLKDDVTIISADGAVLPRSNQSNATEQGELFLTPVERCPSEDKIVDLLNRKSGDEFIIDVSMLAKMAQAIGSNVITMSLSEDKRSVIITNGERRGVLSVMK